MGKKLYYQLEDNDCISCIFPNMEDVKDYIECDMTDMNEDDEVVYTITPVWLTEEEFSQLPEANF